MKYNYKLFCEQINRRTLDILENWIKIFSSDIFQLFKWLPWFELCVVNAVHDHGFIFNTTRNVQDVDCPIMIMHARDDPVIPFTLGEKVK